MLHAPRHPTLLTNDSEFAKGSRGEELLHHIRRSFLAADYRTQPVLLATKATSMSEFIFAERNADRLERGLLEASEEQNPMKLEIQRPRISDEMVDLIRIFLLRRTVPLTRLRFLFGSEAIRLMLRLRVIQAVECEGCRLVSPDDADAAVGVDEANCGSYLAFSNVAVWPLEDDLVICTDFEQTFSDENLEPVMYLSEDSLALVHGATRTPAKTVLDLCCGSGVQGIVALQNYAKHATFVDLNLRALRFTRFNVALNGFADRANGYFHGSLYDALPAGTVRFDAIVANPPFVPNPFDIASGAGAMFGNGGDTGERVLASIVRGAPTFLERGGRLSTVSMAPNVEEMPARVETWLRSGSEANAMEPIFYDALVFRGTPTPADNYQPTSTQAETRQYQETLRRMKISSLSETVMVLCLRDPDSLRSRAILAESPQANLWSDNHFLKIVVQSAVSGTQNSWGEEPVSAATPGNQAGATEASNSVMAPRLPARSLLMQQRPALKSPRREGSLPGFQAGFFPDNVTSPMSGWERVAQELGRVAEVRQQKAFHQR
eukprot:TRINITY_DN14628_c0_g2_i1.p1 TRINITY_DN14628_c0_g2~~TRINITY_DN14628_c0_g2_i1.p1  ORF type:complete len:574 (-),score=81.27 TRINITY_DN14628_c0_g2_i1:48-1694(-)